MKTLMMILFVILPLTALAKPGKFITVSGTYEHTKGKIVYIKNSGHLVKVPKESIKNSYSHNWQKGTTLTARVNLGQFMKLN